MTTRANPTDPPGIDSEPIWPRWTRPPEGSLAYEYNFGQIGLTRAVQRALEPGPATTAQIIAILDATGAPVATVLKNLERRGIAERDPGVRPTRWRLVA